MQIASFILVNDRIFRLFEEQLETMLDQVSSPNLVFLNLVPRRLQDLGEEHPISIPVSSLFPLDQAAGRQHERMLSAFEDPRHPSRLGKMAESVNFPMYYVPPARVKDFAAELEALRLLHQIRTDDVETLMGRRIGMEELPTVTRLIEQFRHDLFQVYHDAADLGMGVVVLVVNQTEEMASDEGFPRAA